MFKELSANQAKFIGLLAKAARLQRDAVLGKAAEAGLNGASPGRGEHNPTAELGFEPLPADAPEILALRDAVESLSATARQELYALMRIGQGHLSAKKWHRGLSEAEALGDDSVTATMTEDADLHDHIAKGLYEAGLSS
jgi:hypothetical protein